VSPALRFWGSAAGACIAITALAPVIIALSPAEDRQRVWLLTVFTGGVMLVLFGAAALISGRKSVGLRDVIEAKGVGPALARVRQDRTESPAYTHNAAAWCVVTGALLIAAYFALWMALG
jgi:Na+/melibiose symporter-like transporter